LAGLKDKFGERIGLGSRFGFVPQESLDEVFGDIFRQGVFRTEPLWHQKQILAWALPQDRVMLWMDIGTGKTLTSLYLTELWMCKKILVVCPNSVIKSWVEQVDKHIDKRCVVLKGTAEERWAKLKSDADIFVINFEGLLVLFWDRERRQIDYDRISALSFDGLIVDECHHVKSYFAICTRICAAISRRVKKVILMAGTPISSGEIDLWAEYYVLDGGKRLGRSFLGFRNSFFDRVIAGRAKGGRFFYNYIFKPMMRDALIERISDCTIYCRREDCLDLPDKIYEVRYIQPSQEQKYLLEGLVSELQPAIAGMSKTELVNSVVKMSQIVGGFYYADRRVIRLKSNPKMDELALLLDEIREKVIIFHEFVEEGRMIEQMLTKQGIQFASLRGEIKDKDGEYRRFKEDDNVRVLVAHPASGGEGLNLQEASVAIFYSQGYSGIVRQQAEGRIWRQGQKRKCVFIDLVMEGTVDEIKKEAVERKIEIDEILKRSVERWQAFSRGENLLQIS